MRYSRVNVTCRVGSTSSLAERQDQLSFSIRDDADPIDELSKRCREKERETEVSCGL